jgi:hypothetical protein
MIDLEEALTQIVELAPEPPDFAGVTRRARQRRMRRSGAAIAAVLVVAVGLAGAVALRPTNDAPKKKVILGIPKIESVRVTLLDGSQLDISGPPSLGLTKLEPAFNAQLDDPSADTLIDIGHSFTVQRRAPIDLGPAIANYPTHDGHDLVVHSAPNGALAVVQYEHWALVVSWNRAPTYWALFAAALNAHESASGYLVMETKPGWRLGPTDAPDVQLGGDAYGSDARYSFFGPKFYASGCPAALMTSGQTPQGWDVGEGANGSRFWCDADAHIRVVAWDPNLVEDAVRGLRVSYTDPGPPVDDVTKDVTALDGESFEITGPASVLDYFVSQATVEVDGLSTTAPMVINVSRTDSTASRQNQGTNATADGNQLAAVRGVDGEQWLEGKYGDWYVQMIVAGVSREDRARIASLFAAHVNAGGYLVLDPHAPMHLAGSPASPIVLDGVDILPMPAGDLQIINRAELPREIMDRIHVRRIG